MKTNPRSQKRADPRVARTTENSNSARCGPDQVEQEFAETLRQAAYIFEKEENGRFQGSILACRAVARFIHQRDGGAELAGPFLQIAAAFEERKRGGNPRLFSKKSAPEKERERSPERKHIHMLAAAVLEVLMRLTPRKSDIWAEDSRKRDSAANKIALHINKWPSYRDVLGLEIVGGSPATNEFGATAFLKGRASQEAHQLVLFASPQFR